MRQSFGVRRLVAAFDNEPHSTEKAATSRRTPKRVEFWPADMAFSSVTSRRQEPAHVC